MEKIKDSIKERVIVLLFKTLEADVFERVFDLIKEFVKNKLDEYTFIEEWRKIPHIKKPRMTNDGSEPDWSQMCLSVFRIARLVDKENGILIQLSENFLTINSIHSEKSDSIGDVGRLLQFYEKFVPCLDNRVGSCFKQARLKFEIVYSFDQEMLQDFIIDKNHTGKNDYFDIQSIIHPGIESKPEGFDMNPPLNLASHYSLLHQGKIFELEFQLDVSFNRSQEGFGWGMCIDLIALNRENPDVGNRWGAKLLQCMSDVQYECIQRLLTKDACEKLRIRR